MSKGQFTLSLLSIRPKLDDFGFPDNGWWIVDGPLYYRAADGAEYHVERGTVTDFASIPRFFWRVLPPWGKYGPAAVLHDDLYARGTVSRERADQLFLEAMEALEVPWLTRSIMHRAVRLFGWGAWNKHRNFNKSFLCLTK